MRRAGTRSGLLAVVLVAAAVLGACSDAPDDRVVPQERSGPSLRYVALGGDDAAGGRSRFGNTWPHVLFRTALPRSATLLDLAQPRSGIADVRTDQVPRALAVRPQLVTITLLDDAERRSLPDAVEADLDAVLDRFASRTNIRVLVGTVPDGAADPATVTALNAAIHAAAQGHPRVTVVDLTEVGRADTAPGAARTARAFARAARAAGVNPSRSP